MDNIKNKEKGKLEPAGKSSDRQESDKQMLDFDEVNYEQRREPYKEKAINNPGRGSSREGFLRRP